MQTYSTVGPSITVQDQKMSSIVIRGGGRPRKYLTTEVPMIGQLEFHSKSKLFPVPAVDVFLK